MRIILLSLLIVFQSFSTDTPEESPIKNICVFCSSFKDAHELYMQAARDVGKFLGESKRGLTFGGANVGLMNEVANAASDAKAPEIVAILPGVFKGLGVEHKKATNFIYSPTFFDRKEEYFKHAQAFMALPGGMGTIEEIMSVITMKQITVHKSPIILFDVIVDGKSFWKPFIHMLQAYVDFGTIRQEQMKLFKYVTSVDQIEEALKNPEAGVLDHSTKWWESDPSKNTATNSTGEPPLKKQRKS